MRSSAVAGSAALALALITGCGARRVSDETAARVALAVETQGPSRAPASGPVALSPASLRFVQPPTPLRGANGLACRDRQLIVAESLGERVLRVTADGGFEALSLPSAVRHPEGVAFAPNGDLLVVATAAGEVWRRHGFDGGWQPIARGIADATGVAIDDAGRIFIGSCASGGTVLEVDGDAQQAPRVVTRGLSCPGAMVADADGSLIVPLPDAGAVVRIRAADGKTTALASDLRVPIAVRRAADGQLVVLEAATGTVRAVSPPTGADQAAIEIAKLAPGIGDLTACGDSVVVSNFLSGEITAFKPWPSAPRVLERGGLTLPRGLAQTGDDLLVSDGVSIKRLRGGRADVLAATTIDAIPPPFALALGAGGVVWITVPQLGEVHRVDLTERTSQKVAGGFDRPTSILASSDGGVIVADTGAGRIVRIEADGSMRTLASGLVNPLGLAARGGQILTTEPTGGRVLGIREGSPPALIATGLSAPGGVAVDASGHVFVAETRTSALVRIDADGSHRKIATGFSFGDAESDASPIAMLATPDGSILLALASDGSVVRVTP